MSELITPKQFCEKYNISIATLYRLKGKGGINFIKIGRATRIKVSDAVEWLKSLSNEAA